MEQAVHQLLFSRKVWNILAIVHNSRIGANLSFSRRWFCVSLLSNLIRDVRIANSWDAETKVDHLLHSREKKQTHLKIETLPSTIKHQYIDESLLRSFLFKIDHVGDNPLHLCASLYHFNHAIYEKQTKIGFDWDNFPYMRPPIFTSLILTRVLKDRLLVFNDL